MTRQFKLPNTVTIATEEESYAEGYATGLTWKEKYRPSGPWVPKIYNNVTIGYRAACQENNLAWLRGFDTAEQVIKILTGYGHISPAALEVALRRAARVAELEAALADGSFYKESDIDALQSRAERAEAALAAMKGPN